MQASFSSLEVAENPDLETGIERVLVTLRPVTMFRPGQDTLLHQLPAVRARRGPLIQA